MSDSSPTDLASLAERVRELDDEKRQAVLRRNAAIRAARASGERPADLTRAAGLHGQMIHRIIAAAQPPAEAGDVAALAEAGRTATARHEAALALRNDAIRAAIDGAGVRVTDVMKSTGLSRPAIHLIRTDDSTH